MENRYAIVIGINDYEGSPLNYCVNDANGISEVLIKKCRYKKENVFKITSEVEASEKDITGKYLEILRLVGDRFRPNEDSILFYFAGHGACINSKSMLKFQNSSYPIEDVFANFSMLKPKIQTYIIDACESGSKVLTRGKDEKLENYIKTAQGAMFLYACRVNEGAQESPELEHGRLTYNILQAINSEELYDKDGYLTFNGITDYVQKETCSQSNFTQKPVIENNVSGFYPFAFKDSIQEQVHSGLIGNTFNRSSDDLKKLRGEIQEKCKKICDKELDDLSFENYNKVIINEINDFGNIDITPLKKEIVNYVEDEEIYSLKNIICSKLRENNANKLLGNMMQTIALLQNQISDTKQYIIDFNNELLEYKFIINKSLDINNISFISGYIIYQAKWGVVILKISSLLDWDGEQDCDIKDITIDYLATPLEKESLDLLESCYLEFKEFICGLVDEWNENRRNELTKYKKLIIKK
ncbi:MULTISPECIES: caspase family protein [Clostridium]|uniref:caspase family protein n=1 Tax=Clostridium TaxID=1485 RepID=UPI00290E9E90|nr:caspase family protein [Clostridium sp.]MDU6521376.1 caspase family protein [Clostridium sp.]